MSLLTHLISERQVLPAETCPQHQPSGRCCGQATSDWQPPMEECSRGRDGGFDSDTELPFTLPFLFYLKEVFWIKSQEVCFLILNFYLFSMSLDKIANSYKWRNYTRLETLKFAISRNYLVRVLTPYRNLRTLCKIDPHPVENVY